MKLTCTILTLILLGLSISLQHRVNASAEFAAHLVKEWVLRLATFEAAGASAALAPMSSGTSDKFGGDSRVKNPNSKYQTGIISSSGDFTLTDNSQSWPVNSLAGLILQPDVNAEVYYLIKSNSANTITVYGSDSSSSEEQAWRHVSDDGAAGDSYAVLDQWSVGKLGGRWWIFDPYGNSFILKAVNVFGYEPVGYDKDYNAVSANLLAKKGGTDWRDAYARIIDEIKEFGFNATGSINDTYNINPGSTNAPASLTPSRYMPFIAQVRVGELTLSVPSFTVNSGALYDATNANFQSELASHLQSESGARTDGWKPFDGRTHWQSSFLTPYSKGKFNTAANPYLIGYDWDEEPTYLQGENTNDDHMGYRIITSAGTTDRKLRAIGYLQSRYATIGALNSAWGSSFANWTAIQNDTGAVIDSLLSSEPYIRNYGAHNETNAGMKADLDGIAQDFWSVYTAKVRGALDSITAAHKLNFGPGYHGWMPGEEAGFNGTLSPAYLFKGSVGNVDVIGIGDPLHSIHNSLSQPVYAYMSGPLKAMYDQIGIPMYHESVWLTAEADSGITRTGTIKGLGASVLTDTSVNFQEAFANNNIYGFGASFWLLLNEQGKGGANRKYFRIKEGGVGVNTLTVDYEVGPGNTWDWDNTPDMTAYANIGDTYQMVFHDAIGHINATYQLYVPLTQGERAIMYTDFVDEMVAMKSEVTGEYFLTGYSHFSLFDYGLAPGISGNYHEKRNFGFYSPEVNRYDGVESTVANGETQDAGNFTGPVREKLRNIYDVIHGLANGQPSQTPSPKALTCQSPTNLTPSGGTPDTTITLEWDRVPDAVSYGLRLDNDPAANPDLTFWDDARFATCAPSPHYYCENGITAAIWCTAARCSVPGITVETGRTYAYWVDPVYSPARNYCDGSTSFTVSAKPVPSSQPTATPFPSPSPLPTPYPGCIDPSYASWPSDWARPCPAFKVSAPAAAKTGTLTLTVTPPASGTHYVYRTVWIDEKNWSCPNKARNAQGALLPWCPLTLQGAVYDENYLWVNAAGTLTLDASVLQNLATGLHYLAAWDWTWDAAANCYKGPDNACTGSSTKYRLQMFEVR